MKEAITYPFLYWTKNGVFDTDHGLFSWDSENATYQQPS